MPSNFAFLNSIEPLGFLYIIVLLALIIHAQSYSKDEQTITQRNAKVQK